MKLENKRIYLTGEEYENGEILNDLKFTNIYNHYQAVIYYKSGIKEIDTIFYPKGYVKNGYLLSILASVNGMILYFVKYSGEDMSDLGTVYINRSNIINFEELKSSKLEVVKKEESKHMAKNMLRKGFAVASVIGRSITDKFTSVNTEFVEGYIFNLYYYDNEGVKNCVSLYCEEEHKNANTLFLNTYYKNTLPKEAIVPLEKVESNCFIATACYRDIFSKEVIFFRNYRDNVLTKTIFGLLFIKFYYKTSPLIYNYLFRNPYISNKIKIVLNYIYNKLNE
ncbi:CFI-box-CTERM domain-containing protein [Lutibacter aestuarii]|uniref:CFI-box-CTERM domain-containing protein n=1 Tax=Lutibacter aestuarii TaxID=861111 RepID=A0ABW2Z7C3_9FLAO